MIVSSNTDQNRAALWGFLQMMGVHLPKSDDFQALGRVGVEGKLIGVVGFNGFVGTTACMHTAGFGNWVSRALISQSFHYPFVQVGIRHLFATVAADNKKALRFDRKMGFKDWNVIPQGWKDGVDLIILKMSREECRWISAPQLRKVA